MSPRFLRHHIVGSEVARPRPIAYLRPGWPRRRSGGGRWRPTLLVAGAALAALALVELVT